MSNKQIENEVKLDQSGVDQVPSKPVFSEKSEKEVNSEKAMSHKDNEDKDNPLDLSSETGSGKCKSVAKKTIKLPKGRHVHKKQMTSTFGNSEDKSMYSLYKAYGRGNQRLRYMKSMSPRKKMSRGKY